MDEHELYMRRCLQLAALGMGRVAPNPMVGAVLVHEGEVIGEGYHQQYGEAHAEVNCIQNVPADKQHLVRQSTLYVSLEPCTHFGKTPPCADLIIRSGIPAVVIGCRDAYEKVNGTGIAQLQAAGIRVTVGILETEARELNKRFFTFHTKQRPYIILKWAQSHNRKIAAADFAAVKISNDCTNRLVHKWRSEEAAILVGTNTALQDNPALTTRLWPGKNPVRLVIDRHLTLPSHLQLFDRSTATIIINTLRNEELENLSYYQTAEQENLLAVVVSLLYQRQLVSLVVEGGAGLLQSFIKAGLWDEARVISHDSLVIENGIDAPVLKRGELYASTTILSDQIHFFRNRDQ